ncbi:MAG: hypothetical protein ACLTSZ_09015 [Lachnospiraceae bacterium]
MEKQLRPTGFREAVQSAQENGGQPDWLQAASDLSENFWVL